MEDAATGEIRLSVLWEWLHKSGPFTADDPYTGVRAGEPLTEELFLRLLDEEFTKLLEASNQDVHEDSKQTTLAVDCQGDRQCVCAGARESAVVHRPAQHQP